MYQTGDYVVKVNCGVCKIQEIVKLDLTGEVKEYYVLIPHHDTNSKMYLPTDVDNNKVRKIISKDEAWDIIHKIPTIEETWIENEKQRELKYKEALQSSNPEAICSIIKTIYLRKKERLEMGKKNTAVDEKYFKLAEDALYSELAFAIGKEKSDMSQIIEDVING